jgi:hypothetical protein
VRAVEGEETEICIWEVWMIVGCGLEEKHGNLVEDRWGIEKVEHKGDLHFAGLV